MAARAATTLWDAEDPEPKARASPSRSGDGNGHGTDAAVDFDRRPVDDAQAHAPAGPATTLSEHERELLGDLFAVIEEHAGDAAVEVDRELVRARLRVRLRAPRRPAPRAPARTSSSTRWAWPRSAPACGSTPRRCAPRCCTTPWRTRARRSTEVREEFGEEIATLVDGVTKLTGITFQSRDDRQAENYRKMIVAMASDIRVILIKLADRLHNMRTIDAMPKQKQQEKAKETLEIFAPLAHRLGIHAIKWELEDLAFATLHPRKYKEIKGAGQPAARGARALRGARGQLPAARSSRRVGIEAEISGRAKHFYSIYSKMTKKGREFNEIYDLTAMRVLVELGEGLLRRHRRDPLALEAAAGPLQGLGRDAQVQHVPGAPHDGDRARGPAARDPDPHAARCTRRPSTASPRTGSTRTAGGDQSRRDRGQGRVAASHLLDWQKDVKDPQEFVETLKVDLFEDEVFVFTPKGEVKSLPAGATPLDFAYDGAHRRRPPLRRRQGERQDRAAPLPAPVRRHRRGAHLEEGARPLARLAVACQDHARAVEDPRLVQARAPRGLRAHRPRDPRRRTSSAPACRRRRSRARRCSPT